MQMATLCEISNFTRCKILSISISPDTTLLPSGQVYPAIWVASLLHVGPDVLGRGFPLAQSTEMGCLYRTDLHPDGVSRVELLLLPLLNTPEHVIYVDDSSRASTSMNLGREMGKAHWPG